MPVFCKRSDLGYIGLKIHRNYIHPTEDKILLNQHVLVAGGGIVAVLLHLLPGC